MFSKLNFVGFYASSQAFLKVDLINDPRPSWLARESLPPWLHKLPDIDPLRWWSPSNLAISPLNSATLRYWFGESVFGEKPTEGMDVEWASLTLFYMPKWSISSNLTWEESLVSTVPYGSFVFPCINLAFFVILSLVSVSEEFNCLSDQDCSDSDPYLYNYIIYLI